MRKPGKRTVLIVTALALTFAYPWLAGRFQASREPGLPAIIKTEPTTTAESANLQLSTQLDRASYGGPERPSPDSSTVPTVLWLCLLFALPFGIGYLLARNLRTRSAAEAGIAPVHAGSTSPAVAQEALDQAALVASQRALEKSVRRRDRRIQVLKRKLKKQRDQALAQAFDGAATGPAMEAELNARLQTQQAVIESLEALVEDNRGAWSNHEMDHQDANARLRALKAELAASAQVIEALEDDVLYWRSLATGEPVDDYESRLESRIQKALR